MVDGGHFENIEVAVKRWIVDCGEILCVYYAYCEVMTTVSETRNKP